MKDCEGCAEQNSVEYLPSRFTLHTFTDEISEKKIIFQVLKMMDSLLIYVNDRDNRQFNDLSLAMPGRYGGAPVGTRLIGNFTEEASRNVACRLSKKVNKVVFLSCNLEPDRLLMPLLEKRLHEEIKKCPDKF